ncbi:hypothetical protein [Actinomycetospora termitidis]|uniref:Uncharacterized protein n=1 Tax=Actinomycetospora termitidis TaxID=3053470 RepID=A0ABT7M633_9PSEU|nr:hypothetical protein [Actinomycetospora sp. Odt1-22]MDL5155252.1 hypothetical protein [Actinomycetospora sp. Odt1-22]
MGEWVIALLVPFLVIGAVALVAGLITLRLRRRSIRRMSANPPQPDPQWQGAHVEPLVEREVDAHRRGA